MSDRQHGTYAKYKLDNCRCYDCCFATSQYGANRERALAYGTWRPFVDAEPVRQHVRALGEFGIGWKRAARLAGLSLGTVRKLLHGSPTRGQAPSKGVRARTAKALLSVEPCFENLALNTAIDGTGTQRRLQALVAAGWPQARLATRLGITSGNLTRTIRSPLVTILTARRVRALYDDLWSADPREHGVDNQAYQRSLNYAVSHRWAPFGAWDDDTIDNPTAFPDWTGHCGTPQGYWAHRSFHVMPACQPCRDALMEERWLKREAA